MSLKIVLGEDRDITVQLKDGNGNPLDLTDYISGTNNADILAEFCDSGVAVTASFSGGSIASTASQAICGLLIISLTDTQTGNLDTSSKDFEVTLTDSTANPNEKSRIIQLKGVLEVVEKLC